MTSPPSPKARLLLVDADSAYSLSLKKALEQALPVDVAAMASGLEGAQDTLPRVPVELLVVTLASTSRALKKFLEALAKNFSHVRAVLMVPEGVVKPFETVEALLLGLQAVVVRPKHPAAAGPLIEALAKIMRTGWTAQSRARAQAAMAAPPSGRASTRELVAIGASTGGPPVIQSFMAQLPPSFRLPILITQHMEPSAVPAFVDLLQRMGPREVRLAKHGQPIEANTVYLAGEGKHLSVIREQGRLVQVQDDGPEENYVRPAVDPLFRSVAAVCRAASVGVVMTGIGVDGAQGARAMRAAGAPVLIQDQASSVVWGMPGAVAQAGAASEVVPGPQLAQAVMRWVL